jgi:predicted double-glycine peptidase
MKNHARVWASLAILAIASGCGYLGSARPIDPDTFDKEPGWLAVRDLQFERQKSDNDCGAASVAMVLNHWGLPSTVEEIAAGCPTSKDGIRAGDMRDLIKKRGLQGYLIHGTLDDLKNELAAKRPVIVGLVKPYVTDRLNHYEVVMAIHPEKRQVATLDPAKGPRQNTYEGFLLEWEPAGSLTIVVTGRDGKQGSRLPSSVLPPKTAWLEAGSSKLEAATSTDFRTGSCWYAEKPLTPLMAAPHPGGAIPFPSGCRRPSLRRNAGESRVIYRYEGRTGNQEVCVARFDE